MQATVNTLRALAAAVAIATVAPGASAQIAELEVFFHTQLSLDGLQSASDSVVSPDGLHVYVAGRRDDAIAIFSRAPADGTLTYLGRALWNGATGGTIPDLNRPIALAISPDGAHLYVAASVSDAVVVLERDETTGGLTYVESLKDNAAGEPLLTRLDQVTAIAVSPDGADVYAASLIESAITVFNRDGGTGALTPVQSVVNGAGGVSGIFRPRDIAISADGQTLYTASTTENAVGVFDRDGASGLLTFVEREVDGFGGVTGLDNARDVAVTADGLHVYAAAGGDGTDASGALVTFSRNGTTGALAFVESITAASLGVTQPNGLAITPDDALVLMNSQGRQGAAIGGVADGFDGSLAALERNPATGHLILRRLLEDSDDGANGIDGLRGAFQVDLSPDGANAYVASEQDFLSTDVPVNPERGGALAVFEVPEPGAAIGAGAAVLALGALRRRATRKTC